MENCNLCGKIAEYSDKAGPICYDCIRLREETLTHPIIKEVVELTGISHHLMVGPSRSREVVDARCYAIYRLTNETGHTQERIGKMFNKDHSTAHYAIKRTLNLIETGQLPWPKSI